MTSQSSCLLDWLNLSLTENSEVAGNQSDQLDEGNAGSIQSNTEAIPDSESSSEMVKQFF